MKRIVYSIAFFLFLLCCGAIHAQESSTTTKVYTTTKHEDISILRQTISRPITRLQVKNSSVVILIYDSINYIDVVYNPEESYPEEDGSIVIKGTTLIIKDKIGEAIYKVHLKEADLQFIDRDRKSTITYGDAEQQAATGTTPSFDAIDSITTEALSTANLATQQSLEAARQALQEAREQLRQEREQMKESRVEIITDTFEVVEGDDDFDDTIIEIEEVVQDNPVRRKTYYDWEDRLKTNLLWGFNNWGDQWYNGLMKISGDYNLKTSFSSWQIEAPYSIVMTPHFSLHVGVGYESDIYRFTTPLVNCSNGGILYDAMRLDYSDYDDFVADNQLFAGTHLDDWSSRLVTHYITLPIGVEFRHDQFHIALTALPALAINTRHTGLKHELDTRGIEALEVKDISEFTQPYKLDVRLEVRYNWAGIFAQVATMPLFKSINSLDLYPIKIGFMININPES